MKIGDRVFVRGYIDEIRKDTVIIRNAGGYFGTIPSEVITGELPSAQLDVPDMNVGDTISRQAAIDEVVAWLKDRMSDKKNGKPLTERLKDLSSAQPERPKGEWMVSHIPDSMLWECNQCGFDCGAHSFNFCPNCGARMKEEDA